MSAVVALHILTPDLLDVIEDILSPRDATGATPSPVQPRDIPPVAGPASCPACHGEGKHNPAYPNPMTEVDCETCQGSGEVRE